MGFLTRLFESKAKRLTRLDDLVTEAETAKSVAVSVERWGEYYSQLLEQERDDLETVSRMRNDIFMKALEEIDADENATFLQAVGASSISSTVSSGDIAGYLVKTLTERIVQQAENDCTIERHYVDNGITGQRYELKHSRFDFKKPDERDRAWKGFFADIKRIKASGDYVKIDLSAVTSSASKYVKCFAADVMRAQENLDPTDLNNNQSHGLCMNAIMFKGLADRARKFHDSAVALGIIPDADAAYLLGQAEAYAKTKFDKQRKNVDAAFANLMRRVDNPGWGLEPGPERDPLFTLCFCVEPAESIAHSYCVAIPAKIVEYRRRAEAAPRRRY